MRASAAAAGRPTAAGHSCTAPTAGRACVRCRICICMTVSSCCCSSCSAATSCRSTRSRCLCDFSVTARLVAAPAAVTSAAAPRAGMGKDSAAASALPSTTAADMMAAEARAAAAWARMPGGGWSAGGSSGAPSLAAARTAARCSRRGRCGRLLQDAGPAAEACSRLGASMGRRSRATVGASGRAAVALGRGGGDQYVVCGAHRQAAPLFASWMPPVLW